MTRKHREGNGFVFWFGFLFFLTGTLGIFTITANFTTIHESPINLVLSWVGLPVSSFCIYFGLGALLQAGLGVFWNEMLESENEPNKAISAPASSESN